MTKSSAKIDFSNMPVRTFFSATLYGVWPWCVAIDEAGIATMADLTSKTEEEAFAIGQLSERGQKEVKRLFSNTGQNFSLR